jgi:THO complex subunit 1
MSKDLAILSSHLSTLLEARSVSQQELDPLVAYAIQETKDARSLDTRRAQWEYLLKNEVFKLAVSVFWLLALIFLVA